MKSHRVPTKPIAALIARYLAEHPNVILNELSEDWGCSRNYLYNITSGTQKTIDFDLADKIVTKLDVFAWFIPPLSEHYWPPDTRPPDESRPVQCMGCGGWMTTPDIGSRKLYCSHRCKSEVHRRKKRKEARTRRKCAICRQFFFSHDKRRKYCENPECKKRGKLDRTNEFRARKRAATSEKDGNR